MHLHGRALPVLLPKAVDDLEEYYYAEGEVVCGLVLGWNFGDGHLHGTQLMAAVQEQCRFEAGELRCVFIESQPLGRGTDGQHAQTGCPPAPNASHRGHAGGDQQPQPRVVGR